MGDAGLWDRQAVYYGSVYLKTEGSFQRSRVVALARTVEIVYRYWIPVYAFIGARSRTEDQKNLARRAMGTTELNGTVPFSSDAQVPRKFLSALA